MTCDPLDKMVKWVEVWNRVCAAANPDDGPCPTWEEVVKAELPGWGKGVTSTADGWEAYMSQRLYHLVEAHLWSLGRHPTWPKRVPQDTDQPEENQ